MKTWKDITLSQAIEIGQLGEMEEIDLIINQMAIIRDTTTDQIESLSPSEFVKFVEEYKFMGEMPKAKRTKTFKKDGKRYQMVELTDLNLAQMVDIEEYYTDGLLKNAHKILSVLYLPVVKKGFMSKAVLEEYKADKEREDMFLEMDMEFVWQNLIFFWIIGQIYTRGLMDSSADQIATTMQSLRRATNLEDDLFQTDKQSKPNSDSKSGTGSE